MRKAGILHNPGAGAMAFTKKELTGKLDRIGLTCHYRSTKKNGWKKIEDGMDLLIVAGGDGTVRKVVGQLLARKVMDRQFPMAVIPLGTANNISKALHGVKDAEAIMNTWQQQKARKFDVGKIDGLKREEFFIEGIGVGVFPKLMQAMQHQDEEEHPKQQIKTALELLYDLILGYKPKHCILTIDGRDYSGKYVMVEIMNIPSIGPNLYLAPDADPGDGCFDIVLIPERDQNKLALYILHKIQGIEEPFDFEVVRGKQVEMAWDGTHLHVDDQLMKVYKGMPLHMEMRAGILEFLATEG